MENTSGWPNPTTMPTSAFSNVLCRPSRLIQQSHSHTVVLGTSPIMVSSMDSRILAGTFRNQIDGRQIFALRAMMNAKITFLFQIQYRMPVPSSSTRICTKALVAQTKAFASAAIGSFGRPWPSPAKSHISRSRLITFAAIAQASGTPVNRKVGASPSHCGFFVGF